MMNIVLLGKTGAGKSASGNTILGREEFSSKSIKNQTPVVQNGSVYIDGETLTVYDTPGLFDPETTNEDVMRQWQLLLHSVPSVSTVFLLVMKIDRFSPEEKRTVELIEKFLGDLLLQNTWILFTRVDELSEGLTIEKCISETEELERVVQRFNNRYHVFNNIKQDPDQVRGLIEKIKANQSSPRMNLVLCGSNRELKSSISDLILGQREFSSESRSVCVRREAEVCGRLISLVELPALYSSQLSEEEVMRETLRCVSLCDPGVHAFLLVNPAGPLIDDDKGELEKIQMIFGSSFNNHIISVITTESQQQSVELDKATKQITETFKRHCVCVLDDSMESVLMNEVNLMLEHNSGSCYTSSMYLTAQVETQLRYKTENEELKETIRLLSIKKETQESSSDTGDLRVVLLGKTGVGKSATGNTILGEKIFRELISSKSVTSVCQKESAEVRRRRVTVTDTPGLFDTSISNEEIVKEIAKCITMAAPGPHVFLLVLTVGQRFTEEEKEAVKMIQDRFGEESRKYTMVLFTRGDDLWGTRIDDYIKDSDRSLQNIINQCGNRYHVFNNRNTEDQTQVTDLLEKIDCMVAVNGGSCYTNEMFQQVEKALREEQERILKEKKEEIEREKEELRAKHEAELEKLKKMLEEKQQNLEKERREKKEEFQKREAQIKEETNKERKKELDEKLKEQREAFKKEMEKKEQSLKQMKKDLQYQKEKYKRKIENIWNQAKMYARRQAEKGFFAKLEAATGPVGGAALGAMVGGRAGPVGAAVGALIGAAIGAAELLIKHIKSE